MAAPRTPITEATDASGPGDLGAVCVAARLRWPGVAVSESELAAYIEAHVAEGDHHRVPPHAEDMYLACACARGDEAALAAFESSVLAELPGMLASFRPSRSLVDEVAQVLRQALFVAVPGRVRRIGEYAGRGPLRAWLRVAATREAIRILERTAAHDVTAAGLETLASDEDPELRYMRRLYGESFQRAFRQAVGELRADARELLRAAYVESFGIDQLATALGIHRATAARRLARARESLLTETRRILATDLQIDRDQVDSILRLLDTGLEASVRQLLS